MTLIPITVSVISHIPHEFIVVSTAAASNETTLQAVATSTSGSPTASTATTTSVVAVARKKIVEVPVKKVPVLKLAVVAPQVSAPAVVSSTTVATADTVPFFSQFYDITAAKWKKVGCGITSLAMIIDYYKPGEVTVNSLLGEGIAAGAYEANAGWSHQGLIDLAVKHGLTGRTHDMSASDMQTAFAALSAAVQRGPVIASVHYTFSPTNPIPHLVVVSGIKDGMVYYNDPAAKSGGGSISADTFKSAWKKRYIGLRASA